MATSIKLASAKAKSNKPSKKIAAPKQVRASATKAMVLKSRISYKGRVFSVSTDTVIEPGGVKSTRDVVRHNGSVIILAVDRSKNPADPTILIERQYRHDI